MRPYLALIATLTALSTPSLAEAQIPPGYVAYLDTTTSTAGTNQFMGNHMIPGGKYEVSGIGGGQAMLTSITAELQISSGGIWKSFNPPIVQTATTTPPNWSSGGWSQIPGGASYRVLVVMTYQYKLDPNHGWTTDKTEKTNFEKTFP